MRSAGQRCLAPAASGGLALLLLAMMTGCGNKTVPASGAVQIAGAPIDISGVWLPDSSRAQAWPAELPLTPPARTMMASFDATKHDPTIFCMPLGTPRNMLQTEYPLEIVQTPQRVLMVLQPNLANTEVRRIPLDGSPLPESPDPSWFGTSRGRWEGTTLVVETIGLRPDAPISANGLTHSASLRVIERLSVAQDPEQGRVLIDEIELQDPQAYQVPLQTRRVFVSAPQAQFREASCVETRWIDKLWRDRLREHAATAQPAGKSR